MRPIGAVVVLGIFASIGARGAEGTPRIKIATAILAQPASQVAMLIQLERSEALPRNSFVRLRGLPPSVSLTEGFAVGPGVWAVPLVGLATLKVNVPAGASGESNLLITLVDVEGTILAEAATALVVGPTVVRAPADQQAAAPSAEHKAFTYRPAGNSPPAPQPVELSERVEKLLTQGERHLAQGNVAAARAFFRNAAEAGFAVGATLLATTYDPVELQRLRVVGVVADRNEARKWYERARELDGRDDPSRFTGCKC